jgi:spectinomycin phosphotransferase
LRDLPQGLDETDLIKSLYEGWGLEVASVEYSPVGGGSYHWVVTEADGRRYFVTVDDLDESGYLGPNRELAFEGLQRAFGTAGALNREGGLEFVLAPEPTRAGEIVRRIDSRYTVAVFPFIDGTSRGFYENAPPEERAELVRMLVRLHRATPVAEAIASSISVQLPGREGLERSLQNLESEWAGGPFSEPARALLADHHIHVLRLLDDFDQLAGQVAASGSRPVITHGEPHGGNFMRSGGRLILIDWDTAGLAVPERDLWHVDAGDGAALNLYSEASGRQVNKDAIALYRLRWKLDDIASFAGRLQLPHSQTADAEHAWRSLRLLVENS